MKKHFIIVGAFIVACFSFTTVKNSPQAYINKYSQLAIELNKETGVPASLILAVASVESGYGNSRHSRQLHNHFGIVGGSETGAHKPYSTRYRLFASDENSFRSFAYLMADKYKVPVLLKQGLTVNQVVTKIKRKYADVTHEEWEQQVKSVIKSRNLNRYDQ